MDGFLDATQQDEMGREDYPEDHCWQPKSLEYQWPKGPTLSMFHFQEWISAYRYLEVFVLLMLGIVGLPIPDETLLVFTGYLIFRGKLHPTGVFVAAFSGSASGISISYLL